jgi:hypothetical protein
MKSAHMRSGLLALLVLLAVMPACTNSEQLSSGVGPVPIEVSIVNSETRFGRAFFNVVQVTVRPVNPDADEVLGTNPLWMMRTTEDAPIEINLNDVQDGYVSNSPLTVGPYEVQSIDLQLLEFRLGEEISNLTCGEYIVNYPVIEGTVQLVDFGEPVYIDVRIGSGNQLKIIFDGEALATAFSNSWQCRQGAACGGFPPIPPFPAWCLQDPTETGFFKDVFAAQASTFVSFP